MPAPFTFVANIPAGNGVSLLANSTVYFANGTTVVNGNSSIFFPTLLVISPAVSGNLSLIAAANASIAANRSFSQGMICVSGSVLNINPKWTLDANTAWGDSQGNAAQVYLSSTGAAQTVTGAGE